MGRKKSLIPEPIEFKLCIIGDVGVGKTSLLYSFTHRISPHHFEPSIYPHSIEPITVDGHKFQLSLWDCVAIQNDSSLNKLRSLAYHQADCFIVCYAIDNRSSFENVETEWMPELREYCPDAPVILVGTKSDIALQNIGHHIVTKPEGAEMATRITANHFLHCSSKSRQCVEQVFEEAARAASYTKLKLKGNDETHDAQNKKCVML